MRRAVGFARPWEDGRSAVSMSHRCIPKQVSAIQVWGLLWGMILMRGLICKYFNILS